MFSVFKKKIHEPVEQQMNDLRRDPMGPIALSGEACDEVSGAAGPFGHSFNNPIPVNTQIGAYKYFAKLRTHLGTPVLFHRLGSMASNVTTYSVDAYELVDSSGSLWDVIFMEQYHPRRSNKAPDGYTLEPYNPKVGDHPFSLGVTVFCPNFPYDLADAVVAHNGFDDVAKIVRGTVVVSQHLRPPHQQMKVDAISSRLEGRRTWKPFENYDG